MMYRLVSQEADFEMEICQKQSIGELSELTSVGRVKETLGWAEGETDTQYNHNKGFS